MKNSFLLKVIIALVGSTVFLLTFLFLPVAVTTVWATVISVCAFYELSAAGLVKDPFLKLYGIIVSFVIPWMLYFNADAGFIYLLLFLSLIIGFMYLAFTEKSGCADELAGMLFCESVFPLSASLMTPLLRADNGVTVIIMAFITAWGTDAIAQLAGRGFGKTHFVPAISPNKTLEGSVSGVIGNTLIITVIALILKARGLSVPVEMLIICGFVAGIAGETGDLFFSYIKRNYSIKDFGTLIPGHGGVLDRFDSVLFVLPVWYLFIRYFSIE